MSDNISDKDIFITPVSDEPENINEVMFDVRDMEVANWHDLADGKGLPTEVHIIIRVPGISMFPLVIRFKSARSIDQIIAILQRHRDDVWP
jgi:hypothetical protein